MRTRWSPILIAVAGVVLGGSALLLAGCVAELAMGAGEAAGLGEAAAAEGAAGVGGGAASLRLAAGAEGAGAAVIEMGEELSALGRGATVRVGALRPVLAELRSAGSSLSIDMAGQISRAGRYLASIEEDGAIVVERGSGGRFLVGKLGDGRIWQIAPGGGLEAIGELRGFVPGRGIRLRSGPGPFSPAVEILRPNLTVEVVGYRSGWFEVRLLSGERGYLWSPFVAVTMVLGAAAAHETDRRDPAGAEGGNEPCSVLSTGRLVRGEVIDSNEGGLAFADADGNRLVVDRRLCLSARDTPDSSAWDWARASTQVALTSGALLYAKDQRDEDGVAVFELADGTRILADPALVKRPERQAGPEIERTAAAPQHGARDGEGEPGGPPGPGGESLDASSPVQGGAAREEAGADAQGSTADGLARELHRDSVTLLYSIEDRRLVYRVAARLRSLGASVTIDRYDPPRANAERFVSFWAQRSSVGAAIRDALSDLVPLDLEPTVAVQRDAVWLR